ncbi:MAG: transcriptional regulator [Rhizonema sp. PD38]|nr:transcriptional regulator [Rhizonema sp. PD38]
MTLTFNPETYASLLAQYKPKVIKTDEENEQAIVLAEELAHRENRTGEESALFDLLLALIEKYEDEKYPMGDSTPHSMLLHLMEARDLKQADLEEILGSSEVVSEVVNGKREISLVEAKVLGEFFHVEPKLFGC